MLSKRRRYAHGHHARTAHQDLPYVEKFSQRLPNSHPRKMQEFEGRVRVARRWILSTIKEFFRGALYAASEGNAVDILNKKVRPNNTRLGRGKDRYQVITAAFKGLVKEGHIIRVEDRAIYGIVAV